MIQNHEYTSYTFNPLCFCTADHRPCLICEVMQRTECTLSSFKVGDSGYDLNFRSDEYWALPLSWDSQAKESGSRPKVICATAHDLFDDGLEMPYGISPMPERARVRLFHLIDSTPNLDWLLLTKLPHNIVKLWHGGYRDNVWLGTILDEPKTDWRVECLARAKDLVKILFVSFTSYEYTRLIDYKDLDLVINQGEGTVVHGVPIGTDNSGLIWRATGDSTFNLPIGWTILPSYRKKMDKPEIPLISI